MLEMGKFNKTSENPFSIFNIDFEDEDYVFEFLSQCKKKGEYGY